MQSASINCGGRVPPSSPGPQPVHRFVWEEPPTELTMLGPGGPGAPRYGAAALQRRRFVAQGSSTAPMPPGLKLIPPVPAGKDAHERWRGRLLVREAERSLPTLRQRQGAVASPPPRGGVLVAPRTSPARASPFRTGEPRVPSVTQWNQSSFLELERPIAASGSRPATGPLIEAFPDPKVAMTPLTAAGQPLHRTMLESPPPVGSDMGHRFTLVGGTAVNEAGRPSPPSVQADWNRRPWPAPASSSQAMWRPLDGTVEQSHSLRTTAGAPGLSQNHSPAPQWPAAEADVARNWPSSMLRPRKPLQEQLLEGSEHQLMQSPAPLHHPHEPVHQPVIVQTVLQSPPSSFTSSGFSDRYLRDLPQPSVLPQTSSRQHAKGPCTEAMSQPLLTEAAAHTSGAPPRGSSQKPPAVPDPSWLRRRFPPPRPLPPLLGPPLEPSRHLTGLSEHLFQIPVHKREDIMPRLLGHPMTNPIPTREPKLSIDCETQIPEGLFHALVESGRQARNRGQHVLSRGPFGNGPPRLVNQAPQDCGPRAAKPAPSVLRGKSSSSPGRPGTCDQSQIRTTSSSLDNRSWIAADKAKDFGAAEVKIDLYAQVPSLSNTNWSPFADGLCDRNGMPQEVLATRLGGC